MSDPEIHKDINSIFDPKKTHVQDKRLASLFDAITIKDNWHVVSVATRQNCGCYHPEPSSSWSDCENQDASIVFATNGLGTLAAVRVVSDVPLGIISMIHFYHNTIEEEKATSERTVTDEIEDLFAMWADGICLEYTG